MAIAPLTSVSPHRSVAAMGGGSAPYRSPSRAAARLGFTSAVVPKRASEAGAIDSRTGPYALWLLRLTLGAMLLQHVMHVVFGYVPPDTSALFGLPRGVSPLALGWDALVGLALLYGVWPRIAALAAAATLSLALLVAHGASPSEFGWQNPLLWIVALLAFALAGDGAFTLVPSLARKELRP